MEVQKNVEKTSERKSSPSKRKTVLKKLDAEAAKLLQSLNDKANKKNYGRKVRDSEIILKALLLMEEAHIGELQEQSLTEKDRLQIAYERFQKENGKTSMDQFIGHLLKAQNSLQIDTLANANPKAK